MEAKQTNEYARVVNDRPFRDSYRTVRLVALWDQAEEAREFRLDARDRIVYVMRDKLQSFRRRAKHEGFLSTEIDSFLRR